MTHTPPSAGAPVACDMTTARDTPEERLRAYGRLFERSLIRRVRTVGGVVLTFTADARETVEDLARREAACCPFIGHSIEAAGDEVVWTLWGDERPEVGAVLDAFHALPDDYASSRAEALISMVPVRTTSA